MAADDPQPGNVAANLSAVRRRIESACQSVGRDPGGVRLLPVSKTHPASTVRRAYALGLREFGESRVQEAQRKAEQCADLADLAWVQIGHLQTNKVKYLVRFASEFQALDSLRLARELQRRLEEADRVLSVLIEVNTSGEESKFGVAPHEVLRFANDLAAFDRLDVQGLMTIALPGPEPEPVAACFSMMQQLQTRLRQDAPCSTWNELSMGMSADLELAIAHGSTTVRIGTAIFGARP